MPATVETARIRTPLTLDNKDFLNGLDKSLGSVRSFARKASDAMKRAGRTLSVGVTAPILGAATAAVKLGTDLDREMRNIQSVSKDTDAEVSALSDEFVEMSTDITKTTDSATGLAAGFYDIQGSGFAGADAMQVLEASTKAASAGLTSTETASAAVAASLNAYGENADAAMNYSDLLFRTVDVGVGSFEELSNSIGFVVGTAAQAGVGFDEISAALSTASKQGISFQKGARALNMLILSLIDPSTEMADALKEIGFQSGQTALDTMGLSGTLRALEEAGYGGTEGLASLGLSSMSLRGALALTGEGAEMFEGDLAAMQSASEGAGATQEAFAIQTKSVAMQMANAKNKVKALALGFRELLLPPLLKALKVGGKWLDKLLAMDDHTKKIVVGVAAFAAALGPALIVLGKLVGALATLAGFVNPVTIAITALAAAFATNFMGIRDTVMPVLRDVKKGFEGLVSAFQKGGISAALQELGEQVLTVIDKYLGREAGDKILKFVNAIRNSLATLRRVFLKGGFGAIIQKLGEQIYDVVEGVFGPTMAEKISTFAEDVRRGFESIADAFREKGFLAAAEELGSQLYGVIEKVYGTNIADSIATFVGNVRRGIENIIAAFQDKGIAGAIQELGEQIYGIIERQFGTEIANRIALFAGNVRRGLEQLASAFREGGLEAVISEFGTQAYTAIEQVFGTGIADRIAGFAENVRNGIERIVGAFQDEGLPGAIEEYGNQIQGVLQRTWEGITSRLSTVAGNVRQGITDIAAAFREGGAGAAIQELGEQIYGIIERNFGTDIADRVAKFASRVREGLGNLAKTAKEFALDKLREIGKGIYKVIEDRFGTETANKVAGLATSIKENLNKLKAAFEESGVVGVAQTVGEGIYNAIETHFGTETADKIARFAESVSVNFNKMKTAFEEGGLSGLFEELGDKVRGLAKALAEGLGNRIRRLARAFRDSDIGGKITEITDKLAEFYGPTWKRIKEAFAGLGEKLRGLSDEFEAFKNAVVPLMKRVGAIIVPIIKLLGDSLADMGKIVGATIGIIVKLLGETLAATINNAGKIIGGFLTMVTGVFEGIETIISGTVEVFKNLIEGDWQGAIDAAKGMVEDLKKDIETYLNGLVTFWEGIFDTIYTTVANTVDDLLDTELPKWEEFKDDIIGFFKNIKKKVSKKIKALKTIMGDIDLTQIGKDIIAGIKQGIEDKWGELKKKVEELLGNLPGWAKKILDISSPSRVFIEIGAGIIEGLVKGVEDKTPEAVQAVAEAVESIVDAFSSTMEVAPDIAEFPALAGFEEGLDRLIQDVKSVLVKVRTELLDLWGWKGAREDTVWGHMVSWAEAVSGVVGVIAQAVEAFKGVNQYTGIMPGIAERLAADIKRVVTVLMEAIGDIDVGVGSMDVRRHWMELASSLIGLMTDMIEDLEELASFEGPLFISITDVIDIMDSLGIAAATIDSVLKKWVWPIGEAEKARKKWLEFQAAMVGLLAGAIEDLQALAEFEGPLFVSVIDIIDILDSLSIAAATIDSVLKEWVWPIGEAEKARKRWLEFQTSMIALLTDAIDGLEKISAFEGDINLGGVRNLTIALEKATKLILKNLQDAIPDISEGSLNDLKKQWLDFSTSVIGIVSGAIESLNTIGEFEGDIDLGGIANLTILLEKATKLVLDNIRDALPDISEGSLNDLKKQWLEFSSSVIGIVAGAIENLKSIGEYQVDIEGIEAAAEQLTIDLASVTDTIITAITENVPALEDESWKDRVETAWANFATGLVEAISGAVEDLAAIGDYVPVSDITPAVNSLVSDLQAAVDNITTKLEGVSWTDANAAASAYVEESETLLGHIAGIISNLEAIGDYENTPLTGRLRDLINNLTNAVNYITDNFPTITLPEGIADSADNASEILGYVQSIIPDLKAIGDYESTQLTWQLRDLINNLKSAVNYITDNFPTITVPEGLADSATNASEILGYIQDIVPDLKTIGNITLESTLTSIEQVVSDIEDAFGELNSLANLPTEEVNLVEAGKRLVKGLTDGMIKAFGDNWSTVINNLSMCITGLVMTADALTSKMSNAGWDLSDSFIQGMIKAFEDNWSTVTNNLRMCIVGLEMTANALTPKLSGAGRDLGKSLVNGMIAGLNAQAGALYATIRRIVDEAIAAANAAAQTGSESKVLRALGQDMATGLISGLEANRAGVYAAMSELMAPIGAPSLTPAVATVGAGGAGSRGTVSSSEKNTTINVNTLEPASVAREVELAQRRLDMEKQLSAYRG